MSHLYFTPRYLVHMYPRRLAFVSLFLSTTKTIKPSDIHRSDHRFLSKRVNHIDPGSNVGESNKNINVGFYIWQLYKPAKDADVLEQTSFGSGIRRLTVSTAQRLQYAPLLQSPKP